MENKPLFYKCEAVITINIFNPAIIYKQQTYFSDWVNNDDKTLKKNNRFYKISPIKYFALNINI